MAEHLAVRFRKFDRLGAIGGYDAEKIRLGIPVIVKTDRGLESGVIEAYERPLPKAATEGVKLKKVLRYATTEDLAQIAELDKKEDELLNLVKKKSKEYELPIKAVAVEYLFDLTKAWVFYSQVGEAKKVHTRDLARDLSSSLGLKVEFKQLNQRETAKVINGLGHCGLTLCCSRWLDKPKHVTVKMVKEQGLPVNPAKTSGQCGRLMCCLAYELGEKK